MNVDVSDVQLRELVEKVVRQVVATKAGSQGDGGGVFNDMNDAVNAAHEAFLEIRERSMQCKKRMSDAVRQMALDHKEELAAMTVEETGMGRVDHKIAKYVNAAKHTPGAEYLQPRAWSGKNGLAVDEWAPYGVIGNITPSTHPGPVMINSIIMQVLGGNALVFNPHPVAKRVNARVIQLANQYMQQAGAPKNLATCVKEPTLETAKVMFGHDKVMLLAVAGGPMVVDLALSYPKRSIAAGPGNPPVLIDETADLKLAAREITDSASFDNNVLCIAEKEIFVVEQVYEAFMQEFQKAGNYRLSNRQMDELGRKALKQEGKHWIISREHVGKSAQFLARSINLNIPAEVPMLFGETGADHPWVLAEQMTCCIPVVKVKDFKEGVQAAIKAEHHFKHTASVYTRDMNRATRFAREFDSSIVTINGGTLRGNGGDTGEAYFSHTIATPTGEGITTPLDFVRKRRIMTHQALRFV